MLKNYITKEVPFKFRGIGFRFSLSQGLFSSADIDSGSRLLLKVLSRLIDDDAAAGKPLPRYVLDSGCGAGLIGICAAAAIRAMGGSPMVRCQDRDELARLFTSHNAQKNGIPISALRVYTEPLLAAGDSNCREDSSREFSRWDLIVSNIPAKAGKPVLEDFVFRSPCLLTEGGKAAIVVVHTLADFFRELILSRGKLLHEEKRAEHCVFVYGGKTPVKSEASSAQPIMTGSGFLKDHPFYIRAAIDYTQEDIPLRLKTVHGAPGFDDPGGAVLTAAKLIRRIGTDKLLSAYNEIAHNENVPVLVHEPGQGFFPCWLLEFLRRENSGKAAPLILSGRNILALEAARHNVETTQEANAAVALVPAADLRLGAQDLLEAIALCKGQAASLGGGQADSESRPLRFGFIAAFPELLPQSSLPKEADQLAALWESLPPLLAEGGVFVAAFGSSNAERFDRKKPAGFTRLGDIKRKGFRALGYCFR